ncbi:beta-lactamase family protein, partial [Nonomuraea sp. K274]
MAFNAVHWQARLDELCADNHVPGASLAVLTGGDIHELATGVLHRGTGVEVTTGSVFQIGSITKVYTATLIMQLVESGVLDLDARVADVLPGFAVADTGATRTVTVRQLLSHTSGISGDFTLDTGRGDDCLARYVDACAAVGQDFPPGTAGSYSSTGYTILGRIVEVLTGLTWDDALRERVCAPLGLTSTVTLPEDVLRFRAAMGHLGEPPVPAPVWNSLPRSAGPYGGVLCATAADVVRLARAHLDGGVAPDGTRVLAAATAERMRRLEAGVPDKGTAGFEGWGLGWTLYDWHGVPGFGHDGATISQYGYLRVAQEAGVIIALLANGGGTRQVYAELFGELLAELAGVR